TTSQKVSGDTLTVRDYPLGTKRPELVKTSTSKSLDDITLKSVLDGTIKPEDVRVTAETLKMQAQVARDAG
ncbi:propanediol dehydratase small subunit PduE, partial [Escherichia coli]|nr:propanediol dehydratase small subunit PduE [Escherichia coli]